MDKRLSEAINEWLVNYKKNSVKPSTYDRLQVSYGLMQRYSISRENVGKLSTDDIQKYLNELVNDGYAFSTIKKQFTLLTAYLKYACSNGYIERPIYLGARLPSEASVKKRTKTIETYNPVEQKKLMKVLTRLGDRTDAAIILMMENGLRAGEAMALEWSDVNWERRCLTINKTVLRLPSEGIARSVQNGAKSKSSNRKIPLSTASYDCLERLMEMHGQKSKFIFYDSRSPIDPITYDQLRWRLKQVCKQAGVEYKGNHALRHTFATNCYNRGCDVKILSKLLGHADVGITYNTYIHLYGDALEEMRSVIG